MLNSDLKKMYSNPILKDAISFSSINTSELRFKTFLQPQGGQLQLHYHTRMVETFKIIKGELHVVCNSEVLILKENDTATVKPFDIHRFYNASNSTVTFEVTVRPCFQMADALKIMYGLAKDGKTNRFSMPYNPLYLAIGLYHMDAYVPKFPLVLQKTGIRILYRIGKAFGLEKKLKAKYCY